LKKKITIINPLELYVKSAFSRKKIQVIHEYENKYSTDIFSDVGPIIVRIKSSKTDYCLRITIL